MLSSCSELVIGLFQKTLGLDDHALVLCMADLARLVVGCDGEGDLFAVDRQ